MATKQATKMTAHEETLYLEALGYRFALDGDTPIKAVFAPDGALIGSALGLLALRRKAWAHLECVGPMEKAA